MDYNGWKNWDTWNAQNWLTNEEYLYEMVRKCRTSAEIEELFCECFIVQTKFGLKVQDDINLKEVDWDEIYDSLRNE